VWACGRAHPPQCVCVWVCARVCICVCARVCVRTRARARVVHRVSTHKPVCTVRAVPLWGTHSTHTGGTVGTTVYHWVCVCVRARARVSESARVRACVSASERACVRARARAHPNPRPVRVRVCVCAGACVSVCERACAHAAHRAPAPTRAPAREPRRVRARQPRTRACGSRARPAAPRPERARGRGGAAHRSSRLVSAESDAGTVPLVALVCKDLRNPPPHGRRPDVPHTHARPGG
jgi:hypothetical protein